MEKSNFTTLLILLIGILALVSCSSSDNTTKYDYCVYMEKEICLSGSYESCPNGGTPSNTCPNGYNKGESNSSSSENVVGGSSSSSGGYTGGYGSVEHCGKKYKTVVIGTQTWFAENVNCSTASGSKCHNDPTNCSKYGRLYNWETAKTVCPTSWHLPDSTEWETLLNYAGGRGKAGGKLKATSGWNYVGNGTDELGFSALPGGYSFGYIKENEEEFFDVGDSGYWWTATYTDNDSKDNGIRYIFIRPETDEVKNRGGEKGEWYSVRCIKN
jgi:uncharacterized protein (TIGR02145 family)